MGRDGGIANVVIWLRSKNLPSIPSPRPLPPIKILAEPGRFEPHVLVFWNVRHLEFVNDMDEATNVNLQARNNQTINPLLKPGARLDYVAAARSQLRCGCRATCIRGWGLSCCLFASLLCGH